MKISLDGQPSVTIAYCTQKSKLLMAVYDGGYNQLSYRFSANNIGGNPNTDLGDSGPKATLIREVRDEYNPDHGEKTKFGETVLWAPQEDIALIRDSLVANSVPYQDFYVRAKQLPDDPTTKTYVAIYSGFRAEIPAEVIECAEDNLRRCRRLSTEGLTGVFTLDDLANDPIKGNLSTAHATAPMINRFLGSTIPFPEQLTVMPMGVPKDSYQDYFCEFDYKPHAWKH